MRILGIDPGTAIVGYGVIDTDTQSASLVNAGVITTDKSWPIAKRLLEIYQDLTAILAQYRPDQVAVEELFFVKNVTNGISVAMARGVILLACVQAGLHATGYKPMSIKLAVAGHGHADKRNVQEAVRDQLKLVDIVRPDDAADGLAIALTHFYSGGASNV